MALGAADAGIRAEDASGMVWVAAELLAPDGGDPRCRIEPLPQKAALHFETVDSSDAYTAEAAETMAGGTNRLVSFKWNAATGELSFTADTGIAALTLPEDFVKVASAQSIQNCEPR